MKLDSCKRLNTEFLLKVDTNIQSKLVIVYYIIHYNKADCKGLSLINEANKYYERNGCVIYIVYPFINPCMYTT